MAFLLGRRVVFTDFTGSLTGAYGRFAIVNMVSLALATGVSWLAYRHLLPMIGSVPYDDYVAHILGLGSAAIPSYLGHRYFTFRVR
jgi:putative flippase GtrA